MIARRDFLCAALGLAASPIFAQQRDRAIKLISPASQDGKHFVAALQSSDTGPSLQALPVRGHGVLLDPRHPSEILVIARRPGTLAIKLDVNSGHLIHSWPVAENRQFLGHAAYSTDGSVVFVAENDTDHGKGIITVRDARNFQVLAEYQTGGIGPHEVILMPDQTTLAVANGGIKTLPETGRVKLNRGRIETSLAYLDSRNGALLGKFVVPSNEYSLRHLVVTPSGKIAAALQFEGNKEAPGVPLMMFHHGETALQFAAAPQTAWNSMRHYAASVAYDAVSDRFALTCPKGNTLACWAGRGEYIGSISIPKVSGIAIHVGQAYASNELGQLYQVDLVKLTAALYQHHPSLQWDNHLYIRM